MHEQIIHRLQSTLRIFTEGETTYIQKIATARGEKDIIEQVELLSTLPRHLACHYPELIHATLDTSPSSYTMRYYPWSTFRQLVLKSRLDDSALFPFLKEVVRFLFEQQHRWRSHQAYPDYALHTYVHRIWNRLLDIAAEHPVLHDLVHCHRLTIGNEELPGASLLLRRLEPLLAQWFGPRVCSTHGQMGFSHILVDTQDPQARSFVLLDAKGRQAMFDPAYDVGKLWECSAGFFDWIEEEHFTLGEVSTDQQHVHINSLIFDFPDRLQVCMKLHEHLQAELTQWAEPGNQEHALLSYRVAAAAHLLGSVDFFYRMMGLNCAIASYVQGVRQLALISTLV
jgi:hypothetical protein